jgi:hypothetical protein
MNKTRIKKGEPVMKKSILDSFVIGLVLAMGSVAMAITTGAGITGTLHDLSTTGSGGIAIGQASETRICIFCHTPHFSAKATDPGMAGVNYYPLWNHEMSSIATYVTYTNGFENSSMISAQLNATVGQPGGVSKLCLSCHDGSIAVNSYGHYQGNPTVGAGSGSTGIIMPGSFKIGASGDLSNHHPIGFNYAAVSAVDDEIYDASTPLNGGTGLTINDVLWAGKVECVSCHSVHNKKNEGFKFLWVNDNNASALCLSCHNK